jgi:primosomal protein N' (replication factor Y)
MIDTNRSKPDYVDVAVPLPIQNTLTYAVPEWWSQLSQIGSRVLVPVARKKHIGIVVAAKSQPLPGVKIRSIEGVLDEQPILPLELVNLALFAAEYYLTPIGEVVRAMIPSELESDLRQKIWLTTAGAFVEAKNELEKSVLRVLREQGRVSLLALVNELQSIDVLDTVEDLRKSGRVASSRGKRRDRGYTTAVELVSIPMEALLNRCGRSSLGRDVIAFLRNLGRPARIDEVTAAVECSRSVVDRLLRVGVIRRFQQLSKLDLSHELLVPEEPRHLRLTAEQDSAAKNLVAAVRSDQYRGFMLQGVTGSGKTEVYFRVVEAVLAKGSSAILMVPEIALVPALASAARQRFGQVMAILHSGLSSTERHQEWKRIRDGEARVVLGPRSAVFAPVRDLGLIVVDEEQDSSYKQETSPRYQGRDLALMRGSQEQSVVVVVSATPSLESRLNTKVGKLASLQLTKRVGKGVLPDPILVDLKTQTGSRRPGDIVFSEPLLEAIENALRDRGQIILLRNRRGYAPTLLCRACGEDMRCADCGLPRTLHKRDRSLICHYCGSRRPIPEKCPACAESALEPIGAGTEKIEEQVAELFPDARVGVLDRDAVRRKGGAASILQSFGTGEIDILVGTQMVSKGHHFPNVSLAAVLLADTYLGFPDFRAVERTYSLLTQLSGRAGRGSRPGKVVIQTYHPNHYAIRAAIERDDAGFASEEMRFREVFHYPPFTRMIQIMVRHANRDVALDQITQMAKSIDQHRSGLGIRVSGPAPAPFEKLRGKWRFQMLLRGLSGNRLRQLVTELLPASSRCEIVVDVDPHDLL